MTLTKRGSKFDEKKFLLKANQLTPAKKVRKNRNMIYDGVDSNSLFLMRPDRITMRHLSLSLFILIGLIIDTPTGAAQIKV